MIDEYGKFQFLSRYYLFSVLDVNFKVETRLCASCPQIKVNLCNLRLFKCCKVCRHERVEYNEGNYPASECCIIRPGGDIKKVWVVVRVWAVVGGSGQCPSLITVTRAVPSLPVLVISEIKHYRDKMIVTQTQTHSSEALAGVSGWMKQLDES